MALADLGNMKNPYEQPISLETTAKVMAILLQ